MFTATHTLIRDELLSLGYRFHHSATGRGYISVRAPRRSAPYVSRFGADTVKVSVPNLRAAVKGKVSRRYHVVEYYVR